MDRIVVGRPGTLELTFYDASGNVLPTDAGEPVTLTLTGDRAGLILDVAAASPVGAEPTATWQVALDGTELDVPDLLDADWTATFDGSEVSYGEVIEADGGEYTTVAKVRAKVPSAEVADIADVIAEVASRIEIATGWTWVPRFRTVTVMSDNAGTIVLPVRPLRTIVAVRDSDDDTLDATRWAWTPSGVIHTGIARSRFTLDLEVGEDRVPTALAQAATRAAVDLAQASTVADRRSRADLDGGPFPYQSTSMKHGRPFGLDGVDAVVMSHQRAVIA